HSHAQDTFPNECCGFMYGHENDVRTVTEARLVDNSKEGDQRRRFEISGKDYMDAEKYALEKGMTLLGVYHSHPQHPAIPSEHDRKQALPWFSYTIVSVMDGKVDHTRSWQLDETKQFTEEELKP
ncbi:MAG: M67 family metallopeptidase, partial [Flavobacteriales bacterium]|nr:M67 family metallopeptidase [Flavobacteriales bacterium]